MTKKNSKHSTIKKLILDYMTAYTNKEYSQAEIIRQEIRNHGTQRNGE